MGKKLASADLSRRERQVVDALYRAGRATCATRMFRLRFSWRSDDQIQDVSSFVQTIEQLNERDVIVLKVLKKIMHNNRLAERHAIRVASHSR
jgi:hypothetical protein